ncbi:hypothetical protein DLE60_30290 [Micromonospora globispora]|nr:hypothetical protein DLE60_30290 [Micromonospora globispora]
MGSEMCVRDRAWPVTPAPTWPTTPRSAARPVDPPAGDTAAPVDPAPRPRHLALPDLGRPPARDTLADSEEPVTSASDVIGPVWARHATDARGERTGARHADDPNDQSPAGDGDGEESRTGKSRARRGLFRRNRGRGDEETATDRNDRESEPVPAHDEEYVDWVTGLSRPAEKDPEGRPLRTGRHHRD